jgi:hypothetical protein
MPAHQERERRTKPAAAEAGGWQIEELGFGLVSSEEEMARHSG